MGHTDFQRGLIIGQNQSPARDDTDYAGMAQAQMHAAATASRATVMVTALAMERNRANEVCDQWIAYAHRLEAELASMKAGTRVAELEARIRELEKLVGADDKSAKLVAQTRELQADVDSLRVQLQNTQQELTLEAASAAGQRAKANAFKAELPASHQLLKVVGRDTKGQPWLAVDNLWAAAYDNEARARGMENPSRDRLVP